MFAFPVCNPFAQTTIHGLTEALFTIMIFYIVEYNKELLLLQMKGGNEAWNFYHGEHNFMPLLAIYIYSFGSTWAAKSAEHLTSGQVVIS